MDIHILYKNLKNYLYGRVIGISREKELLHEVVKCLFCKISILNKRISTETMNELEVAQKYREEFSYLKDILSNIFKNSEEILLDPATIYYMDQEFDKSDLKNNKKDILAELYQSFVTSDLRVKEGQFFTPLEAIKFIVEAINPKNGEKIIDPACGTGGFLSFAANYLSEKGANFDEINSNIFGVDKDSYLVELANANIALTTLNKSNIYCGDTISKSNIENKKIEILKNNSYDIVLTNPPFGSKIISGSEEIRREYDLAFKWKLNKNNGRYEKTQILDKNTPPQILFIELCIKLLKENGRLGIVVPESMISNSSNNHIVQYINDHMKINCVIGMPENLFKTSGKGGTHTKTCLLIATKKSTLNENYKIFMAEAEWCGNDSRGNRIDRNDIPEILNYYKMFKNAETENLGYIINNNEIIGNVLAPRYYNPTSNNQISKLHATHDLVKIEELVEKGIIEFSTGDEVGKMAYGTGNIPFIRTSDISNWEIKVDPKHCVSEEIYKQYKDKQNIKEGDIFFVRDGTYLIGSCAYVSEYDTKILYQSHIYKIRINKNDYINPFLFLAMVSSEEVIAQIKSKRFTQDIIDSIGKRILEIILPIPKLKKDREYISNIVQKSIEDRIEAREFARKAKKMITNLKLIEK